MEKLVLVVLWALPLCTGSESDLTRHVPRSLLETTLGSSSGLCSTWGNGAFRTFDDKFYHFTSTCNYILSRHCASGAEDFSIQIRRGSNGNLEHIYIQLEGIIILVANGTILVQNVKIRLPYHDKVIGIYRSGIYIKMSNRKHTISVIWNSKDALWVTLDDKYQGQLCGLCGKFDKNSSSTYDSTFINANKLDVLGHACHSHPHSSQSCEAKTQCEAISRLFLSCLDNRLIGQYWKMCQADVCSCKGSGCKCASFAEIARRCNKDTFFMWKDWRAQTKCTLPTCPGNQTYKECGPACIPTCTDPNPQQQSDHCVNTCVCPEGKVLDNVGGTHRCISKTACPCEYSGTIYQSGEIRNTSCQSCICKRGKWSCSYRSCPGRCTIEEATYFTTFDNTYYTMIGDCSYYAVFTDHWNIKVEIHQCQAAFKQPCLQRVTLTMNQTNIVFSNEGNVYFGENKVAIPLRTAEITVFQQSSMFIQVATTFGLKMQVQILPVMQLYISLPEGAKGSTKGLCGTFNDDADDDFLSAQGIVESTPSTFANSWKTDDSCSEPKIPSPCVSSENENYAKQHCFHLKDPKSAFSICHSTVDYMKYYHMCVAATCACENINDCLCAGLGAYVHECAAHGVLVRKWTKDICKTSCANTQVFENDMRACNRTCRSLSLHDYTCTVKDVPVYGCGCPEGKYMDNSGACIDESDCSCYVGELVIKKGQSITLNGRTCNCENGQLSCPVVPTTISPGCTNGKIYNDCTNVILSKKSNAKTCRSRSLPNLKSRCVPGCVCPGILVEDENGRCVAPEQCPCLFGGESHAAGKTIHRDCNKCTCRAGKWHCTTNPCPKTCQVHGDGQYVTFDGKRFMFDGNCEYTFAEDYCNQGNGTFQILTESVPCCENGVTCSRNIKILLAGKELILKDGRVVRADKSQTQCTDNSYSLHTVGLYLILTFSNGITVIWDKRTRVSITLDPRWKNRVCGLCGNFNDDVADDLTTKGNSLVTSAVRFGSSWRSSPSCSDTMNQTFPCDRNPYCLSWAQRKCSIIKDVAFQKCHKKVDPTPFYDACIQEACACDMEGKYLGFCTAVAVYAETCSKVGVCVDWRTPDLCPVYCDYYNTPGECSWHYRPCGTLTTKTCSDHYIGKKFSAILEGCYAKCPENAPYLDENRMKCVNVSECTCYYNGKILHPGKRTKNDCEECECKDGKVTCIGLTTTTSTISFPDTTPIVTTSTTTIKAPSTTTVMTTPITTTTYNIEETTTTTMRQKSTTELPCSGIWSSWSDGYVLIDIKPNESESLDPILNELCPSAPYNIDKVQYQCIDNPESINESENNVTCEEDVALLSANNEDDSLDANQCSYFRIRACCEPSTGSPTTSLPRPSTSELTKSPAISTTTTSTTGSIPKTTPPEIPTTTTSTTTYIPETTPEIPTTTITTTSYIPETTPPEIPTTTTTTTSYIPETTPEIPTTTTSTTSYIPETTPEIPTTTTTTTSYIPETTPEIPTTTTSTTSYIPETTPEIPTTTTSTTSYIPETTPEIPTTTTSTTSYIPETTPEIPTTTTSTTSYIPETTPEIPTTTTSTTSYIPEEECNGEWSPWFNDEAPSEISPGDSELLDPLSDELCPPYSDIVNKIQCQFADHPEWPVSESTDNVTCDKDTGLVCTFDQSASQERKFCYDYKIRVCCVSQTISEWTTTRLPKTTSTTTIPETTPPIVIETSTLSTTNYIPETTPEIPTTTTSTTSYIPETTPPPVIPTTTTSTTSYIPETTPPIVAKTSTTPTPGYPPETTPPAVIQTTTESTTSYTTEEECNGEWSPWFNDEAPSEISPGDSELLDPLSDELCPSYSDTVNKIQCQFADHPEWPVSESTDNVTCDKDTGLVCTFDQSASQERKFCYDYKIRVCCESQTISEWTTTRLPKTTSTTTIPETTPPPVRPTTTTSTTSYIPETTPPIVAKTSTTPTDGYPPETTPPAVIQTTTESTTSYTTEEECNGEWSPWFNDEAPSEISPGDSELLDLLRDELCPSYSDVVNKIQCQFADHPEWPVSESTDNVTCDKDTGLVCTFDQSASQERRFCYDYTIRVCCVSQTISEWTTTRLPKTTSTTTIPEPTLSTEISTTTTSTTGYIPETTPPTWTTTSTTSTTSYIPETTPPIVTTTSTTSTTSTLPKTTPPIVKTTSTTSTTSVLPETTPPIVTTTSTTSMTSTTPEYPTVKTTTSRPIRSTTTELYCSGVWSSWFNENTPSIQNKGDSELLEPIRNELCPFSPYQISGIDCEAVKFPHRSISETKDNVTCDINKGLICNYNGLMPENHLMCLDYRIRVCCEPRTTTQITSTTIKPVIHTIFEPLITQATNHPLQSCKCNTDPPRKCNETWKENCTMITCMQGDIFKMDRIVCPVMEKPTCNNNIEPVKVRTADGCCEKWECDCECEIWGDPHYRTFDDIWYDFFDDCTYILVEERVPKYNFSVLVDNYFCIPFIKKSCPKGLVISYNGNVVHISTGQTYVLSVNGIGVSLPYSAKGFEITKLGISTYILIPEIRTSITAFRNAFKIRVPEKYFLDNTQGQCGSCSHAPPKCIRKNGTVEPSDCCHKTAYDWQLYDPSKPACQSAPTNVPCIPVPPAPTCKAEETVCDVIQRKPFEECRRKINLDNYFKTCVFDHCTLNATIDCSSLETAALACASVGICVDWRPFTNGVCNYNCDQGFLYKPCRSKKDDQCKNDSVIVGKKFAPAEEGCFCPDGMVLSEEKSKCVVLCQVCRDQFGHPKKEGDVWEDANNPCLSYVCGEFGVLIRNKSCNQDESCPEDNRIYIDRCCFRCRSSEGNCKVNKFNETIRKGYCEATFEATQCQGLCASATRYDFKSRGMDHYCQCCREEKTEKVQVNLHCRNGRRKKVEFVAIKSCICKDCGKGKGN
ncbi:mucin-2-like isoform X3 [Scyliorhinus canicula]|uniref:mucin-2-like isoform X3 n=1 Tax=Scyliorhinus canicula TaxID=7830 RepID=UPI0018F35F88|nr:mucin-2-like isoform X3 [Scyliorhinus canicula]